MIELNIAACSVNKYYRSVGNRVCISADGRIFKKKIDFLLNNYEKVMGKVKLKLGFYFKDNRKRDADNYLKVLIDCLKNKLFEDDDQIYILEVKKFIGCIDKISIEVITLNEDENKEIDDLKIEGNKNKKLEKNEKLEKLKLEKIEKLKLEKIEKLKLDKI